MPELRAEEVEVLEGAGSPEPSSADLKLSESIQVSEGVQDDGTVLMHLIRPCIGRGRGKHLYKAEMLEANAGVFNGWKMFLNHLSDASRRALGGLPRDVRDVGGIVQESWWDPDVPAEGRFGKGAVVGRVKPVPVVQELLKVDPRLVEASINATATNCTPGKIGSERVWIVEGIEQKGSVDWVTEAGAGGRVASIMEALIEDDAVTGVMETLDNGTILAWVNEHRPDLAEALRKPKSKDDGDGNDDEGAGDDDEDAVQALLKSGKAKTRAQAVALVKQQKKVTESGTGGDDVPELTPEVLVEAFASDEGKAAIREALGPVVVDVVKNLDLGSEVVALVEARLSEDRKVIEASAAARADRQNELRDLRDHAHRMIDGSKLTEGLKSRAKQQFDLIEGTPTESLDLVADEDEDGKVEKSAKKKVEDAVQEAIKDGLAIMAELRPTRVSGQGATALTEGKGGDGKDGGEGEAKPDTVGPATRSLLEANGIPADKVEEVYARSL